ncbi:T9SS-dependent choice-of-anchor J family protein [Faecalibacter bovis]|uniref:Choice-of-anchor J domain-containing protein n=1 Tax=Faecalibacter bovis TaxID=2898187 RepID=A0ABX7XBI0_9FLAO|nr:choice-of-anchor J domain-containing protein [Faecalibacter bovis]QTV05268.1 choice-of-anchor J domain-containing protein [Faecalibacter bovis]
MKKSLLSLAFIATIFSNADAQYFTENFDGNGPGIGSWTVLDIDGQTPDPNVAFITNGWNVLDLDGIDGLFGGPAGDHAAASTSWYSPAGVSNDWLITPLINLTDAITPRLRYSAKAQDPTYPDGYQLKVAPNGGNTIADFTDTLAIIESEGSHEGKPWTEKVFGLEQYAGQSIRIAWINNSDDMFMLFVDDIIVEETPENEPQSLPFHESFDSSSSSRTFWTNINVEGSSNWTYAVGSTGVVTTTKAGDANARFVSVMGENTPITKLVSPIIQVTSSDAYLEFYHANPAWASDINALKVYYRLSETSEWVEIFHQTERTETWTKQVIQLPEVSATMQIAFEGINNWGRANVIDEVKVRAGLIPMTTTLPFNETFEDDSTTRAGWTQQNVLGNRNWTFAAGSNGGITTANNGQLNARFYSGSGVSSPVTKLITPMIDAGSVSDAYLQFSYAQPNWFGDNNALKVYYRTSDSEDWIKIYDSPGAVDAWKEKRIQLPALSSELQIAFEGINNYGYANIVDDVQIIEGTLPPLPEVCGINNVSNNLENGIGNLTMFAYANDFRVNAYSTIDVSQISFNLITATEGISTATYSIIEDVNGTPSGDVVYTFTGAPSVTESLGTNFGYSFSKYTYDLPEVVRLENTTNTHKRYWLQVEAVQPNSGEDAYWETTTVENTSEYNMMVYDTDVEAWEETSGEGVFTIVGECNEIEMPETCEQGNPSNNIENGQGSISAAEIAHDFQIEENTQFTLNSIKINVLTSTGLNSATVKVYSDNNGVPGDVLTTFTGVPSTRVNVGSTSGFDSSTYTFNLPEALPLEGGNTYWVGLTGAVYASGTNGYFESSTIMNTLYTGKFNGTPGSPNWADFTSGQWDGVFSIVGTCETLSIGDQTIEVNKLSVYPNPITDVLYIKHKLAVANVEVYNVTGQKVVTTKVKADGSVNLASLPQGVYVVNATLEDGTNQTFKVIKK